MHALQTRAEQDAPHEPLRSVGPGDLIAETYRVGNLIGAGGMGFVYEGEDIRLQRRVAIKVANDASNTEALFAEARALAAIRHHGVVAVHAIGRHEGRDYLVMERLFGRSLQMHVDEARRRKRTFTVEETLDILIGVADALAAVHRIGMAHRDLKPGNVMLCGARIVLVDFGLFVPEYETRDEIFGSPEYIAPEVVRRGVVPGGGPAVDLYALGVIAFLLLTGRTPFRASTVEQTMLMHVTDSPPASAELRPELPAPLTQLVDQLLRKEPTERPSSAEEVLWRLSAIRSPHGLRAGIEPFRTLVVDDDPSIASVLRRALRAAMPQLVVETETDPRVALDEIGKSPPDLVLLDLKMPGMNGIEVAMALAALEHPPIIVATSSSASENDVAVLRSLGARAFVPKDDQFIARLSSVLTEMRLKTASSLRV